MLKDTNRIKIIISFFVAAVSIVLALNASWGAISDTEIELGKLPAIYSIISLLAISYLFRISYQQSDKEMLEEYVNEKVKESNAEIIKEFQQKDSEEESEEQTDDSEETAKELIPSGNFKKIDTFGRKLLVNLANKMNLTQAILYLNVTDSDEFTYCSGYALTDEQKPEPFKLGENLTGEAAKEQQITKIDEIPSEYFSVESGLGSSVPGSLTIVPVISDEKTIAVLELGTFSELTDSDIKILEKVAVLGAAKIEQIVKS